LKEWDIDVLTIRPSANDSFYDKTLLTELSNLIQVYRSYPGPYYSLIHLKQKPVRGFSKTTLEWFPFGSMRGGKLVKEKKYDVIVSSALPFVGHLVAHNMKKMAGVPWIADYGDPLGFNPITSQTKRFFGKYVERHILKNVDGIIVPFEEMKDEFQDFYPFLKQKPVTAIGQGIPENVESIKPMSFENEFVLSYVGSFYAGVHEPFQFFKALENLGAKKQLIKDIRVIIAGNTQQRYIDFVDRSRIKEFTYFMGQVPFEKAVSILKGSSAILYLGGQRSDYHFPSKVLVSAAAGRPIIGIRQSQTDLGAEFIEKKRLGVVLSNDHDQIQKVIIDLYGLWKDGKLDRSFNRIPTQEYYWDRRAVQIETFINSVIGESQG
jgi:hypothetical protein